MLLCETWLKQDTLHNLNISDYKILNVTRNVARKAKRGSGGLLCYIRSNLMEGITPMNNLSQSTDRIWLKLDAAFFGYNKDLFLCFAYISPESSCHTSSRDNLWNMLREEIANFSNEGDIMITGDFNARMGEQQNFLDNDSDDYIPLPPDYQLDECPPRYSQDKRTNNYGHELLDICQSAGLRTLNGRVGSDKSLGQYTCHTAQGSSVVDYTIVSENLLNSIEDFTVCELSPLSDVDHCPLFTSIKSENLSMLELYKLRSDSFELFEELAARYSQPKEPEMSDSPINLKWSPKVETLLKINLQCPIFLEELSKIEDNLQVNSTNESAITFASLLQDALRKSSPNTNKSKNRRPHSHKRFPSNAWFDEECKGLKREVKRLGRLLKASPENSTIRDRFISKKAIYKATLRRKKRQSAASLHQKLHLYKSKNPRLFWKFINGLNGNNPEPTPITIDLLEEHFRTLNSGPHHDVPLNPEVPITESDTNPWTDCEITVDEIEMAIKKLKKGKAPGWDGLTTDMYKCFNGKLKEFLKDLFNQILETGSYPDQWKRGIIKPIFKSGAKSDPSNYRGITLLNTIGKIFTSVINRRLLDWAESTNMINDSQFGFREGRRTIDAIYTLTSVMHLYKKKHKPLYACFVDFRKAFDSINHDKLWLKLTKAGLSMKLLVLLQDIYRNATSVVRSDSGMSKPFPCEKGVRQGCNLSPLLFSLYIADLESYLSPNGPDGVDLGCEKLRTIQFADDLVILAHSAEDLQSTLDKLAEYCTKWNLQINNKKTKVLIFSAKRASTTQIFTINQEPLSHASSYKYLGILLSTNGSLKPAVLTLANQAKKAIFGLMRKSKSMLHPNPSILLHLFDSLVRPTMEYASELWFHSEKDGLDKIERGFCKYI